MRLPGYCIECRRKRIVRVSPQDQFMEWYFGLCDGCEKIHDHGNDQTGKEVSA